MRIGSSCSNTTGGHISRWFARSVPRYYAVRRGDRRRRQRTRLVFSDLGKFVSRGRGSSEHSEMRLVG